MDDLLGSTSGAASNKAGGDFLIPLQTPEQFANSTQKAAADHQAQQPQQEQSASDAKTGEQANPAQSKLLLDFDPLSTASSTPAVTTPPSYHGGSDWLSDFTSNAASSSAASR